MPPISASRVYTGTRCRPSWSGRPRPVGLSCEGNHTTSAGARMARADLGASIGMPRAKWTGATAIVVKVSGIRAEVTVGDWHRGSLAPGLYLCTWRQGVEGLHCGLGWGEA